MKRCLPPSNVKYKKRRTVVALCLTLSLSLVDSAFPQSLGSTLERVEEDWVALLAEPESAITSPQIMNFISPVQSTSGIFGLVGCSCSIKSWET